MITTTLAASAMNVSAFGFQMLAYSPILGQATGGTGTGGTSEFTDSFGKVLNILNLVGLTLAFGGLLFAAVMFMMGQTERMIYGLVGAVIGGMSWIIVKTMFSQAGSTVDIKLSWIGSLL
jgi:hypothetical protein